MSIFRWKQKAKDLEAAFLESTKRNEKLQTELMEVTQRAGRSADAAASLQLKLEEALEVSHAKDGRIIELQGLLQSALSEVATLTEKLKSTAFELKAVQEELGLTNIELDKEREKLASREEELREERQQAQRQAARTALAESSEVNSFPHEKKLEASPGIGDYQEGRTHDVAKPVNYHINEDEWR